MRAAGRRRRVRSQRATVRPPRSHTGRRPAGAGHPQRPCAVGDVPGARREPVGHAHEALEPCSSVNAAFAPYLTPAESAAARWLIRPARRSVPPAPSSSPTRSASSSDIPQRPIPVSTLTCTSSGARAADRSRAKPSRDDTATSTSSTSASWPGTSGLMTSTGASGSSARRARASSHVATHSFSAPASSAARPTCTAPCPYASAFTTAHTAAGADTARRRATLSATAPRSTVTVARAVRWLIMQGTRRAGRRSRHRR